MQDLTNSLINSPSVKGLVTDLAPHLESKEIWTYARNAVLSSHSGNKYALQNEPSNTFCVNLPYTYVGSIPLINNRFAIFTTDNTNSEIGIFDSTNCTYTTTINSSCLNFNTTNLIVGKSKYNYDCSETVYFTDGNNPRRYLNLNNVPYQITGYASGTCSPIYNHTLDCNKILIDPNINVPYITPQIVSDGNLGNGAYQFGVAYSIKKERVTDIYSFTNAITIFSHDNTKKGINLSLANIDTDTFSEYELYVAYTINNYTTYKSLGFYSTTQTEVSISSVDRPEYQSIITTLENGNTINPIFVKKVIYEKSGWVEGNDKYLLWGDLTTKTEINYQPQALNILSNYVIVDAPANYYSYGNNVGYYGDEVYAFAIDWLRKDGSYTAEYHIPGTVYGSSTTANSLDIYESGATCSQLGIPPNWYVKNTATRQGTLSSPFSGDCNLNIVASGRMAYTESTIKYPDNTSMFGSLACKPIRHHKFPNEEVESRFNTSTGNIRIKTIQFTNIEHPKDINGNYLPDITGFRITRSDRSGNRSIIARGYSTNMRSYQEYDDPVYPSSVMSNILYPNYPYNYLGKDPYLGNYYYSTDDKAKISGLTGYSTTDFTFYSPHTLIGQVALGSEIIFESDDIGTTTGSFKKVFNHPTFKLWSDTGLNRALEIGAGKAILDIGEIVTQTTIAGGAVGLISMTANIPAILEDMVVAADEYMKIVNNTAEWQNYAIQYDSYCLFNHTVVRTPANGHRRQIINYNYLEDGLNTVPYISSTFINNYKKPKGVHIQIGSAISAPSTTDNSVFLLSDISSVSVNRSVQKTASNYYTTIKRRIPDQYGTIDSVKYLNTGYVKNIIVSSTTYSTDPIFGGDCFINKFSVNNPQPFFTTYPTNSPDGVIWDYRNYRNIAYPTYWLNSQPYSLYDKMNDWLNSILGSLGSLANIIGLSPSYTGSTDAESRFNLDKYSHSESSTSIIRADSSTDYQAHMYTAFNGTTISYVESDYNLEYRDYKYNISNIYSINSSLDWLYRSDNFLLPEEFRYDASYSKSNSEILANQQLIDFNISSASSCLRYYPNSVIYSLPANQEQKQDHWLFYLPNNIYTFPINDFGNLTSFHNIDNQQIIFLFDKSGPYTTIGRDELQTEGGIKVTIGDNGLFAREPRPLTYTSYSFGSSTSRFSFKPTAYGNYYISPNTGKIFKQSQQEVKEISKEGVELWFTNYLPSKLISQFPNYNLTDNQTIGVGYTTIYDPTYETFIFTKRDYECIDPQVTYNSTTKLFYKNGDPTTLADTSSFKDASVTMSYKADLNVWVSWHDYHPIGYLQGEKHFMSISPDSKIYKHNETYSSYCNFYSVDYPFALQLPINNQATTELIRSIEFFAETYVYTSPVDYFHVLDTTFDKALLTNSEQITGWLHLNSITRNQVSQQFLYPYFNTNQYEIKLDKVENKYRFNQFWDITKDRGEYTNNQFNLINTDSNGYTFSINPSAVNYAKPQTERKKIRHNNSKLYLEKAVSNNNKITLHLTNTKQTISPR